MAQNYVTESGVSLTIPNTYVDVSVKSGQSGVATSGVITLIGESEQGPAFSDESDLQSLAFTPDQFSRVAQKYGSGAIVDAFRAVVAAANDPNITGSVNLVRILKTNISQAATSTLRSNGSNYSTLTARVRGTDGNLIKVRSQESSPEVSPETGSMSYVPQYTSNDSKIIINGSEHAGSVSDYLELADLASSIDDSYNDIALIGSTESLPVATKVGATLTASTPDAETLIVSLSSGNTFDGSPAIGDSIVIAASGDFSCSSDSLISNSGVNNLGSYIISSITNTNTSASMTLKLINSPSASLASSSGTITAGQRDLILYKSVNIRNVSGQNRESAYGMTGTFTSTVSGQNVTLTAPSAWALQPKAGDYLKVSSSGFAGLTQGTYQITSANSTSVSAIRLSFGSAGASSTQNVVTAIDASNEDFKIERQVIDGKGKSMELSGFDSVFKSPSTRETSSALNTLLTSASEYRNSFTVAKSTNTATFSSGGEIALRVGSDYSANASGVNKMEILTDRIDFSNTDGVVFSASYSQFKTMRDLADFISSQSGMSADLPSAKFGSIAPSNLDEGTFSLASDIGAKSARCKIDAFRFNQAVNESGLITSTQISYSGLPEASTGDTFLTGGTKGATTSAQAVAAIDACEKLDTNFIVPLFSKDASDDIASELTDSGSTYTIDAINQYVQAHVLKMSQVKMRKNRIAIVSKDASYEDQKEAASEVTSQRVAMAFQRIRTTSASGSIVEYQPWMGAVIAAGMQAAAGYKGIVKKFAKISGALKSDFDANSPGDLEDALKSGLLILERVNTGGYRWVSDQTTYSVDNNFVYNSLQAVYLADLMTLQLIQVFDRAVVGKSVAEISAAAAKSILAATMFDFLRLNWIAPSDDDAPKGYKNASVKITGPVMEISVEAKLAGLIYFVPINFQISEVQQSA